MSDDIKRRFIMGVDLGQASDPTALIILEHIIRRMWPDYKPVQEIHLRHIYRFTLGTTYPAIVEDLRKMFNNPKLQPAGTQRPYMVVDQTGVGRPVVDMMRAVGLDPLCITITAGNLVNRNEKDSRLISVPKRDLASSLQAAIQGQILKFAKGLPGVGDLRRELLNFKVKVSASGHDAYEAWRSGDHDDLVLATAMPVWVVLNGEHIGLSITPLDMGEPRYTRREAYLANGA